MTRVGELIDTITGAMVAHPCVGIPAQYMLDMHDELTDPEAWELTGDGWVTQVSVPADDPVLLAAAYDDELDAEADE